MITTGPGLIRPIATASVSWRSVNQWWSVTRPWWRKGTTASPEPNVSALALAKNRPRVPSEPPAASQAKPLTVASGERDDRHHRRADAEEDALHLRQSLVVRVQRRDRGHDQERRHDERQRHP